MATPPQPAFSPVETAIGALLLHHSTTVLLYNTGTVLGISGLIRKAGSTLSRAISPPPSPSPTTTQEETATSSTTTPAPSDNDNDRDDVTLTEASEGTPLIHHTPPSPASPISSFYSHAALCQVLSSLLSPDLVAVVGMALSPVIINLIVPELLPHFSHPTFPVFQPQAHVQVTVIDRSGIDALLASVWVVFVGLVTGWGTKLSNGCTSGHMLIGLARFSPRSLAAVGMFFPTAIITHILTRPFRPDRVDHIIRQVPAYIPVYPSTHTLIRILVTATIGALFTILIPRISFAIATAREERRNGAESRSTRISGSTSTKGTSTTPGEGRLSKSKSAANAAAALTTSFVTGLEFGLGLIISGMASSSKVQSFLSLVPTDLTSWDPSLMLVILFGLIPNMVINIRRGLISSQKDSKIESSQAHNNDNSVPSSSSSSSDSTLLKPKFADRFQIPAQSGPFRLCIHPPASPSPSQPRITSRLLIGAVAFGVAWGLEGVCPGPGIIRSVMQFRSWGLPWLFGYFIGSKMGKLNLRNLHSVVKIAPALDARSTLRPMT